MENKYIQFDEMFDREFEKKTWSSDTRKGLKNFMHRILDRHSLAFGGCIECFGKGYATATDGETGERRINFCVCERGAQLERYFGSK